MSTKISCDRCGREVTARAHGGEATFYNVAMSVTWVVAEASGTNKIDLCSDCQNEIYRFAFPKEGQEK